MNIIILGLMGAATMASLDSKPRPTNSDQDMRSGSERASRADAAAGVYYAGCDEVRALGKAPLYAGQPGYRIEMDGDRDGIACEPIRNNGRRRR